jgi:hypothetical protein
MKDLFVVIGTVIVIIGIFVIAPFSTGFYGKRADMRQLAIENGVALYCPHNREFAFVGECEKK